MEHVKEFSPDQKFYAFVDFEGKLKIWDVEANVLKQEYVPNLHLSTPCTALLWIQGGNLKVSAKFWRSRNHQWIKPPF